MGVKKRGSGEWRDKKKRFNAEHTERTQSSQRGERAGKRDLTQRARRRRPDPPGVNEWRVTSGETRKKRLNAEHTENAEFTERRKSRKEGFKTEGAEKTPRPGRGKRVTSGEWRDKKKRFNAEHTENAEFTERRRAERGI